MYNIEPEDIVEISRAYLVKAEQLSAAIERRDIADIKLKMGSLNDEIERLVNAYAQHSTMPCDEKTKSFLRSVRDELRYAEILDKTEEASYNKFKNKYPEIARKEDQPNPKLLEMLGEVPEPELELTPQEINIVESDPDYRSYEFFKHLKIKRHILDEREEVEALLHPKGNEEAMYELSNDFPNLFSFYFYRFQVGPIILNRKFPRILNIYERIWNCYSFSQFEAAIAMCRFIIEETLKTYIFEALPDTRLKNRRDEDNNVYPINTVKGKECLWDHDIHNLIQMIKKSPNRDILFKESPNSEKPRKLIDKIYRIKDDAVTIIHNKEGYKESKEEPVKRVYIIKGKRPMTIREQSEIREKTRTVIFDTRWVIESLLDSLPYSQNI